MMARQAIRVIEDHGRYQLAPNAEPERYTDVRDAAAWIRPTERLHGWAYNWVIETDLGWYFVTGRTAPAPKSSLTADWRTASAPC